MLRIGATNVRRFARGAWVAASIVGAMTCGGKVVVDQGGGDGGAGAGGSPASTSTMGQADIATVGPGPGPSQASVSVTVGAGGMPTCEQVCGILYDCGVEDMNCPGFTGTPMEKMTFVGGCIPGCEANPALASVVNPDDCKGTITLIKGANVQFKDFCENGISDPGGN